VPNDARNGAYGELGAVSVAYVRTASSKACFFPSSVASRACGEPPALHTLLEKTQALVEGANALWRAASHGAISLGSEYTVVLDWPLDPKLVKKDEFVKLGADRGKLDTRALYRLPDGDYVQIAAEIDGKTYLESLPPVVLPAADGALRAELLANQNRFAESNGAWLGVHLGVDAYPAYKNRSLAVLPNDAGSGERYFYLWTIEDMDLTRDEPL